LNFFAFYFGGIRVDFSRFALYFGGIRVDFSRFALYFGGIWLYIPFGTTFEQKNLHCAPLGTTFCSFGETCNAIFNSSFP
jgi:hypothetical protein